MLLSILTSSVGSLQQGPRKIDSTATSRKKKKGPTAIFGSVRFFKNGANTALNSASTAEVSDTSASTAESVMISITPFDNAAHLTMTSHKPSLSRWFSAVHSNNLYAVNSMLSRGVDANALDPVTGWSALHIASWNNWIELTQLLIASGCDLDVTGPGEVTPLLLACQCGHALVALALVNAGCNVTRRAELGCSSDFRFKCSNVTAVHLAARYGHLDVIRCLVSAGAAVDAEMTVADRIGGITPLHLAVEAGHIDVVEFLITAGSDVNTTTRSTLVAERNCASAGGYCVRTGTLRCSMSGSSSTSRKSAQRRRHSSNIASSELS